MRADGRTHKNDAMDEHASQSQKPYPPEATGLERKLLQAAAAMGIILIATVITTM